MLKLLLIPLTAQCRFEFFNRVVRNISRCFISRLSPTFLDGIHIGACSWQEKEFDFFSMCCHIFFDNMCSVPSCSIDDEDNLSIDFSQSFKERDCLDCKLFLDEFVVKSSTERVRSIHVRVLKTPVDVNIWRHANRTPTSSLVSFSSEMSFIYADDFVFICQRQDLPLKVFLKVSIATGSRFLCSGRGTFHDIPILCRSRRVC